MTSPRRLLVSLHDVTPFHIDRIRRAEELFREIGVLKAAYLFVPEYHGGYPSAGDPAFAAWCREPRGFALQWHLHGYYHLETPGPTADPGAARGAVTPASAGALPATPAAGGGATDAFKRRFLTAGEGEFLALDIWTQRRRLEAGLASFRSCLGADPDGFVAPAWLFNASLPPLLRELGIRHTEDHRRLYRVDTGASLPSPVITWATRTPLRKYGSLAVCPILARAFASAPFLRVALHPFDFDHPATVRSIRGVLGRVLRSRDQAFPGDLEFGAPAQG